MNINFDTFDCIFLFFSFFLFLLFVVIIVRLSDVILKDLLTYFQVLLHPGSIFWIHFASIDHCLLEISQCLLSCLSCVLDTNYVSWEIGHASFLHERYRHQHAGHVSSSDFDHQLHPTALNLYVPSTTRQILRIAPSYSRISMLVTMLLLVGSIEVNPGPNTNLQRQYVIKICTTNAKSAVPNVPLVQDIIHNNSLDVAAITEI